MEKAKAPSGQQRAEELGPNVVARSSGRHLGVMARDQDRRRHRGVEVGAGHVAQRIDHAGKAPSNGQSRHGSLGQHCQTNCQDQRKGPDHLADEPCPWSLVLIKIQGAHQLEENCCHSSPKQLEKRVDQRLPKARACAGQISTDGDRRVDEAARNGPSCIGGRHGHSSDGQAVEVIPLAFVGARCSGVEDHEAKEHGVEKFANAGAQPAEASSRPEPEGICEHVDHANSTEKPCQHLHCDVCSSKSAINSWPAELLAREQRQSHCR
mmetsp:Transcript_32686/g.78112  ORF Transcript_32686/g.78112 Transcript_32686/m.78112 type:complete len:266 (+) Transcript_32686:471-1268(+)